MDGDLHTHQVRSDRFISRLIEAILSLAMNHLDPDVINAADAIPGPQGHKLSSEFGDFCRAPNSGYLLSARIPPLHWFDGVTGRGPSDLGLIFDINSPRSKNLLTLANTLKLSFQSSLLCYRTGSGVVMDGWPVICVLTYSSLSPRYDHFGGADVVLGGETASS